MRKVSTAHSSKTKKQEKDSKDGNKGMPPKKAKAKQVAKKQSQTELPLTKEMILRGEWQSAGTKLLMD